MSARLLAVSERQSKKLASEEGTVMVADCLQFAAEDETGNQCTGPELLY